MYIHLMEMSPTPELALRHGDSLATLVPDSGHLLHMATHIDVLCGEYQNVIARNHLAAIADKAFTELRGAENFYTVYRIHNVHFEAYGAMFLAQKQVALTAAEELQQLLPEPVVLVIDTCEELTKPRAGSDSRFNVGETFRILEALHDRVATLRVVFAGRRPLASAGAGWNCRDCELPPRDYLSLFEVRGFTEDEARRYLADAGVPEELVAPVVRRSSPDAGVAAAVAIRESS